MNAYAVYTFPETTELNNETIKAFVKTGHAQFLRWDLCDCMVPGLLIKDAQLTEKKQSVVYVYFKGEYISPYFNPNQVDTLVRTNIPNDFIPSTYGKIDNLQVITLSLLKPIVEPIDHQA